ncbi:MAG: type IX secretion system protein PorQ [Muribaculaceae bacterium]|nr:type IX secretion system protein PorQ [Muribaculaceae bacterium]
MILKRITYLTFGMILAAVSARGQTGRSAYDFLTVPTSSHVFGLGGTNITIIDADVTLAEQNPALLGPEVEKQLAASYMHYLGSANFAGIRYGQSAGEHSAWSGAIRYLNYGEIQGFEADGSPTGSFTPSDFVFEGTYSHDFTSRLRGGINLKMIYSSYEQYSAFAMAADVGINYYDDVHDMSLSVVFKNMGGQIKRFDSSYDRLPFDIQLGWMQSLGSSPFSLSITAQNLTRWHLHYYEHTEDGGVQEKTLKSTFAGDFFRHLIFGAQYQPSERVYVDLAYNYKMRSDMSAYQRNFFSGFSLGLGIKTRTFSVGAAYAMPHKSASTLLINLGLQISELL